MNKIDVYQAKEVIEKSIGYMVYEDKGTLIALLRKNGVQVADNVGDNELIQMTYIAIGNSLQFKKDLAKYIAGRGKQEFEGYVDEEEFFSFLGLGKKKTDAATPPAPKKVNPNLKSQGGEGTKVGNAIRAVATPETIQSVINTGLGLLSDSLSAKADRKTVQEATLLASEKSKQALAEAAAADAKKSKTKTWVIPVVIGVVVVAGIVTYFVIKKRKG